MSETDRLFEAIANYTYDWESWLGHDGQPLWINPAVERMTGYRVAECLAMPDYPLPLVHEEDRALIAEVIDRGERGESGNDVAFRLRRKDGKLVWAAVSWQTLFDRAGRSLGFRTSVRDITERKLSEDALRDAHAEAERANRAKSRFLAAASHDLRQPLQAAHLFAAALRIGLRERSDLDLLGSIEDALKAANELLDALLDVSRLDAGVLAPKFRDFAVADLLDQIETEFSEAAREKRLALRVLLSSATIRTDPTLLGRILRNLVSNALRYTERGKVLIGCRRAGDRLAIEVLDTGIGIAPDKIERIFEEFYQVGNPERDRTRGLGLGLAIVAGVAKLLGHPIEVRSKPGRGSIFRVLVPLTESHAAMASPVPQRPAAASPPSGALLLAIDDDPDQLEAMDALFGRWGYQVLVADSAPAALAKLTENGRTPSAIIADYRLRDGFTGADAIGYLRERLGLKVPGLILTGDTEPARLAEASASGFELLHKPIEAHRLQDAIERLLSLR
ncbi:hybrid sensor histidine kinase/response regulator [Hypericibacter sp.]|uniref:hybrid sensor histidine kinase/response regulator n=1 Tax=Hypericibacter sp. TaxID=2705401 RepID=UPI003D6D45CE